VIDVHGVAEARVRSHGQRYTRNHRAVIDALDRAGRPLSLPELLQRCRRLPQSSAYRSISVLEAAGLVHRLVTASEFARFELAQELTEHHHHHRVCSACGEIEDFTLPAEVEAALDKALGRVARQTAFRAQSHQLDLLGVCANCA
jgi:Fe2+ or Zn2+ uptake regulation protein